MEEATFLWDPQEVREMSGQRLGNGAPGNVQEASSEGRRLGSLAVLCKTAFMYLLAGGFSGGVPLHTWLSLKSCRPESCLMNTNIAQETLVGGWLEEQRGSGCGSHTMLVAALAAVVCSGAEPSQAGGFYL